MPGRDPGIHADAAQRAEALMEWIAGSSPAMTKPTSSLPPSSGEAFDQPLEHLGAVGAAERRIGKALRMRHQPKHGARLVQDAGDVVARAVGIGFGRERAVAVAIAEGDTAVAFEALKRLVIGEIAAVLMGDGEGDDVALGVAAGEAGVGCAPP